MMTERQRNTTAAAGTVIFLGLLLILLLLLSMSRPYPPPPEFGVEVNLGTSIDGMGNIQPETPTQAPRPVTRPQPTQENLATQTDSDFAMPTTPTPRTPRPTPPQEEVQPQPVEPQQPQVNQAALFPPRNPAQSGNEGTTGRPGDQGQPDGSRDATAYSGTPGSGGGGISFSLTGRQSTSLVTPEYDSPDQGTVVVRIWVNPDGVVIRAEAGQRGTTVNDRTLWRTAEAAALRSRFSPDRNAPDQQVGTITYRFMRLN
jgi:TonB family protein